MPAPLKIEIGKNPTIGSLLSQADHSGWKRVRFPRFTKVANVRHDSITLNRETFMPGSVYILPPIIAEELQSAINRAEAVPAQQMSGRDWRNRPAVAKELAEQATFEREENLREAREQLAHA